MEEPCDSLDSLVMRPEALLSATEAPCAPPAPAREMLCGAMAKKKEKIRSRGLQDPEDARRVTVGRIAAVTTNMNALCWVEINKRLPRVMQHGFALLSRMAADS